MYLLWVEATNCRFLLKANYSRLMTMNLLEAADISTQILAAPKMLVFKVDQRVYKRKFATHCASGETEQTICFSFFKFMRQCIIC
jgi:hypothetical protein